jgi:stress-induced morphogen
LKINMKVENSLNLKLKVFNPELLVVVNESSMHKVPKGSETHFRIVVVSQQFEGVERLDRHRLIYDLFVDERKNDGLHAIAIWTFTPGEWALRKDQLDLASPKCRG